MATDPRTLDRISQSDPDGFSRRPTESDYRAFEQWVERTYGRQALKDYRRSGRRD